MTKFMTKYSLRAFLGLLILLGAAWFFFHTGQAQDNSASNSTIVPRASSSNSKSSVDKAAGNPDDEQRFVAGEALVKFKDATLAQRLSASNAQSARSALSEAASSAELTRVFERFEVAAVTALFPAQVAEAQSGGLGGSTDNSSQKDPLAGLVKVTAPSLKASAAQTLALIKELEKLPEVEYATPNYILKLNAAPNDPYYA